MNSKPVCAFGAFVGILTALAVSASPYAGGIPSAGLTFAGTVTDLKGNPPKSPIYVTVIGMPGAPSSSQQTQPDGSFSMAAPAGNVFRVLYQRTQTDLPIKVIDQLSDRRNQDISVVLDLATGDDQPTVTGMFERLSAVETLFAAVETDKRFADSVFPTDERRRLDDELGKLFTLLDRGQYGRIQPLLNQKRQSLIEMRRRLW